MSRVRCQARLRMVLESPFLSRGLTAAGLGVDMAQSRNQDGRVMLPGDMILGNVRQAWDELGLGRADLFGAKSGDKSDQPDSNAPQRGHLLIGDLVAQQDDEEATLTRVRIDDDTGAAANGGLFVVEMPFALGREVEFCGDVVYWVEADESQAVCDDLEKALKLIPAVGAMKSAGFGWVVEVSLTLDENRPTTAPPMVADPVADRIALTITLDRPFLVDARRVADNVFQGSSVIPGAVFKGAVAQRLARAGLKAGDELTRIVFGHAFPADAPVAPLPHSLAVNKPCTEFDDFLLNPEPRLIGGEVPCFAPDWKDEAKVAALVNRPYAQSLQFETRTRTAIKAETGRPEDGQLFSYAAVRPDGRSWRAVLDRNGADKAFFEQVVAMMRQGLDGIGKTSAIAQVQIAELPAPVVQPLKDDLWALVLCTPALLNDPEALRGGTSLHDDYAAYWQTVVGGKLVRHFARHRLAGGYQGMRFRRAAGTYQPYVLTEPGAVFLLQGDCGEALEALARANLPPRPTDATWKTCPFMPENGFGAIHIATGAPHV
jgi:hypothetical protein